MPISFLESNQNNQIDVKLKGRLLMREFASHRYGLFKESGFRSDPMYPPFSSLPGHPTATQTGSKQHQSGKSKVGQNSWSPSMQLDATTLMVNQSSPNIQLRGFDPQWNECPFDTTPSNGLPASHALQCYPYLVRPAGANENWPNGELSSFNMMSSDPFSYVELVGPTVSHYRSGEVASPIEWRDLVSGSGDNSSSPKWHFCGEQFTSSPSSSRPQVPIGGQQARLSNQSYRHHNQLALNKQNIMCNERSAMDIIRLSEDFRRAPFR